VGIQPRAVHPHAARGRGGGPAIGCGARRAGGHRLEPIMRACSGSGSRTAAARPIATWSTPATRRRAAPPEAAAYQLRAYG